MPILLQCWRRRVGSQLEMRSILCSLLTSHRRLFVLAGGPVVILNSSLSVQRNFILLEIGAVGVWRTKLEMRGAPRVSNRFVQIDVAKTVLDIAILRLSEGHLSLVAGPKSLRKLVGSGRL